jgi:hypothetical protein
MTAAVKHMARNKPGAAGAAVPAQPRNSQLRARFPARPASRSGRARPRPGKRGCGG